jgi:hypothetical protein
MLATNASDIDLLIDDEAAAFLRKTPRTLRRRRKKGIGPS